jgi:hypothetical protein
VVAHAAPAIDDDAGLGFAAGGCSGSGGGAELEEGGEREAAELCGGGEPAAAGEHSSAELWDTAHVGAIGPL